MIMRNKNPIQSGCVNYRPQTKFANVMFLHVSVILSTGGWHAWQGGVCMVGGGMHGRGPAWWGACVAGGVHGRYYEIQSMRGRYASYWNAFLFLS